VSEAAIRIENVNKRFGATHAVRDLDLVVPPGSLCGFLGPNGAGKSTTIRMIMSIIYPDTGSIQVLGSSALKNKDRIGYLPEERGLYRKMRVGEFLEYIARLKGMPPRGLAGHVRTCLKRIDLPDVFRRRCQELSKGMQQKVQFLAAVIHEPELIILDEPFAGLDPMNVQLLTEMIRQLSAQGASIIFSTHVLHQAEQLCDRIFLINKGVKLLDATLEEIRERFDPRTLLAEPLNGEVDLQRLEGVSHVRRMHDSTALEVELVPGTDPQQVMGEILRAGPMRCVELRRLTLDEVFIRQVAEDAGEHAAKLAREELSHV